MADMLFIIASGDHIDAERTKRFGEQLENLYADPFIKAKKPMSAADIKDYIRDKIRKLRKKKPGD